VLSDLRRAYAGMSSDKQKDQKRQLLIDGELKRIGKVKEIPKKLKRLEKLKD